MKKQDCFPGAKSYRDRHGKIRWCYRRKGMTAELDTEWGSEEFRHRYAEAENRQKTSEGIGATRTAPGTLNDLAVQFYRLHLPTVAASTAADYRAVIEGLRAKHGPKRVAHLARRHVIAIKAEMAGTLSYSPEIGQ